MGGIKKKKKQEGGLAVIHLCTFFFTVAFPDNPAALLRRGNKCKREHEGSGGPALLGVSFPDNLI